MKNIWLHRASSYKNAKRYDEIMFFSSSSLQRLSDIQLCREQYFKLRRLRENRKRLRRVIKIIKQT